MSQFVISDFDSVPNVRELLWPVLDVLRNANSAVSVAEIREALIKSNSALPEALSLFQQRASRVRQDLSKMKLAKMIGRGVWAVTDLGLVITENEAIAQWDTFQHEHGGWIKGTPKLETLGDAIHWTYANLARASYAIDHHLTNYRDDDICYRIRLRLFNGLRSGTMSIRSLYDDERYRLSAERICVYCGAGGPLTLDHLVSRKCGGSDSPDNLVYACKSCNSSKRDSDLIVWYLKRNQFPPLSVLRRYLKLCMEWCSEQGLLDEPMDGFSSNDIPFRVDFLPLKFPQPSQLHW